MLELNLSKQAGKFLKLLRGSKQGSQIKNKIQGLLENLFPNDSIKMKNSDNFYRCDIGEYRIIYRLEKKSILEIKIVAPRNDDNVYKLFERSRK